MNDARKHARQFLAPLTAPPTVSGLARTLINQARKDTALATLFMDIQDELGNGRDLLDARQSEILDRVETPSEIDLPTAPVWLRPAIVSAYLSAKARLTPRVAADILVDPKKALQRTLAAAKQLEPGFIGEVIIETTLAMQRDAAFASRLSQAADELRPEIAQLYADDPASDIASLAAGSKLSCKACKNGVCTPVSCWIVVVVIVIVIVTK